MTKSKFKNIINRNEGKNGYEKEFRDFKDGPYGFEADGKPRRRGAGNLDCGKVQSASVCVPPCYVEDAVRAADGQIRVCGVAGFPNGYVSTDAKIFEIAGMLEDGAEEIDVVLNIGALKAGETEYVKTELEALRALTEGYILKVIAETCFLTREEKLLALKLIGDCGADFIKTSTGFGGGGATEEDVSLFKRYLPDGLKIKASGGIKTFEQAAKFLLLGCDRIGASGLLGNDFIEEEIKI